MTSRFTPLEPAEAAAHDDVTSEIEFFAQNSERFILNIAANTPSVRAGIRPRQSWNCVTLFRVIQRQYLSLFCME